MKYFGKLISISSGLLVLMGVTLTGLIATTSGSRWVIEQMLTAQTHDIVVSKIEGSLLGTIRADSLVYRAGDSGVIYSINNAGIDWNLSALLRKQLSFESLSLDTLTIEIPPADKSFSLPEFSLPYDLVVERLLVGQLRIALPGKPTEILNLRAAGELSGSQLSLENVSLQLGDTKVGLSGQLEFSIPFGFNAIASLAPASVDASLHLVAGGVLDDYQISGKLEHYPAALPGMVSEFSGRGSLSQFELVSFQATGLDGSIKGSGTLSWNEALRAEFELQGMAINTGLLSEQTPGILEFQSTLGWQDQAFDIQFSAGGQLRGFPLDMSLQLSGDEQHINIREGNIQTGWSTLLMSGEVSRSGTGSLHISLQDNSDGLYKTRIESQAEGESWRFRIADTRVESGHWPVLTQVEPATILLKSAGAAPRLALSGFCLRGLTESACLEGELTGENLAAMLMLENIPVERFKNWVVFSEGSGEHLQGSAKLRRTRQQWMLDAALKTNKNNHIQLDATLAHTDQRLGGKVRANLDELEWLSLLSEQFSHTRGRISADLDLSGTLTRPDISGPIQLMDARFNLIETGASLSNINLTAKLNSFRQARLQGEMTSGKGRLQLSGAATWWPAGEQLLELGVQGTNFTVVDLPEVYAVASPNLNLSIDAQRVLIKGDINLPILVITLDNVPDQAVTVSADARIVGQAPDPIQDGPVLPVYTDVDVQLGKDVRFSGMGFEASLAGALAILNSPDKPLHAIGKIEVDKGSYTAYGQNLSLQQSYFIFNGPVSQPGLDLKAQREIKDVTVGLLVRGTLQSPETEIFSNPAMSDSDAIAYLLTGRPLSAADGEDGDLMLSALAQLGVKGSAGLTEKIRNSTGLSTFEIDSGDEMSETALKIGKYLTPQLYVQYAKRLFADSDSIKARYDINEKLYIETESGKDSSFDIKYKIER